MVAVPLSPHGDANMHDTFMTTYDKEFTHSATGLKSTWNRSDTSSGHTSNRVLFAKQPALDMTTMSQTLFPARDRTLNHQQWGAILTESVKPQVHCTAFVREISTVGINRGDVPTRSTTKDAFAPNNRPITVPQMSSAHYAGDATVQFKNSFLHIASPDNSLSPNKRNSANPKDNFDAHMGSHASRQSLLHSSMLPGSYFQHSRLIGDRSLAVRGQLPVGLKEASDFSSTISSSAGPKSMLSTLAGRSNSAHVRLPDAFETNPIPISPKEQERCRVSHRVENLGNVRGSTYSGDFVNQKNLPELHDPSREKRAKTAVVLPNVKAQQHQTIVLTDSRGTLLPDRPAGVHPAVWQRLKAVEKVISVDKTDPHAHKLRTPATR